MTEGATSMPYPLPIDGLRQCERAARSIVLLDTASPDRADRSLLFVSPRRVIEARRLDQVADALDRVDAASRNSWIAGYVCYESAYALEECLGRAAPDAMPVPLLWLGVFDRPFIFDHATGRWDRRPPGMGASLAPARRTQAIALPDARIDFRTYSRRIAAIKRLIAAGDTYQVNYTYDVLTRSGLGPFELYRTLRHMQPTAHCAFIRTPDACIASFSPELFFAVTGRTIRTKPMKGTAPRGRYESEDAASAAWLAADPKNRSENVMIVDMLRNDLGRVCVPGTVVTERLFEVERHPTVLQMTSTVRGSLRKDARFSDVMRALFPCGSVTGAPKIRTMEIIRDLETGPRGPYCGAIGFIAPRMRRAVFSVPIRTLVRGRRPGAWRFRVGSGIVWDSTARDEWEECATKCAFLTRTTPEFEIFESLLLRNGRLVLRDDHHARMRSSARYFGFPLNETKLRKIVAEISASQRAGACAKVRILLARDGSLRWDAAPMDPAPRADLCAVPEDTAPSEVAILTRQRTDSSNPLVFHKTTHRPWYDNAMDRIRRHECFDVVFRNQRGEITEGARSNIFILRRGKLLTPALDCGLLPGVLRGRLLRSGRCREAVLTVKELRSADAVFCGNSVRGLVKVKVLRIGD